ncbi:MAG: hypothetical protein WCJ95_05655 [Mariniphaga sp.]
MTERESDLLKEFKGKLDKLIDHYLRVKGEKQLLSEENAQLKEQIRLLTMSNEELLKQREDLKFAKSLLGAEEDSHGAKLKINRIVREIDNCIALLNK